MRTPVQATGAAAAETPWVPVNDLQNPFNVALYGLPSQDFAATSYQYQVTPDDPQASRQVSFTTSGTTATVKDVGHGLLTGDSLVMTGTNSTADVTADVTVVDDDTYTYTTGASPPASGIGKAVTMRVLPFGAAVTTGKGSALLQTPVRAVRAKLAGWTVGIFTMLVVQSGAR